MWSFMKNETDGITTCIKRTIWNIEKSNLGLFDPKQETFQATILKT